MSKSQQPSINQESPFQIEELFVSRTDKRGLIEFGNEVFYRVSGYSEQQMIGSPHNIIRHEDMPKSVFKLFWQTIKQNKTIAAYVKNKAIDGRYYWVLATAFPTKEGYLSIRLKPSSSLFEKTKSLYAEILKYEEEKGMDQALEYLLQTLKTLGFSNYDEFMSAALQEELKLRQQEIFNKKINRVSVVLKNQFLSELKDRVDVAKERFEKSKQVIDQLLKLKEVYATHGNLIAKVCEKLSCLAVNMSVSAHKLGKDGTTLSVIANSFQVTTNLISKSYEDFHKNSETMLLNLSSISFGVNCSQIQTEMLSQYLTETDQFLNRSQQKVSLENVCVETRVLLDSVKQIFNVNSKMQNSFYKLLYNLKKNISLLHTQMVRLDLICTGGKLEGSRTNEITSKFRPFLNDMNNLLVDVEKPISDLDRNLNDCTLAFEEVLMNILNTDYVITELKLLVENRIGYEENQEEAA